MLKEKIVERTTDIIGRLDEMRKSAVPHERIWAGRSFVHGEYVVEIKVSLKK